MKENTLLTIYGAKVTKDGKKVVITLVSGEWEDKKYYNTCVKLDHSQKTDATISKDGMNAIIKIPILRENNFN